MVSRGLFILLSSFLLSCSVYHQPLKVHGLDSLDYKVLPQVDKAHIEKKEHKFGVMMVGFMTALFIFN